MDSSVVSGLIGGVISIVLVTYVSNKLRKQASDGTLRWGWGIAALGVLCLAIVGLAINAFFVDEDLWTDQSEFIAWIALLVGFGAAAGYCFLEYFLVHGTYDDRGITFYTPWTGLKTQEWSGLKSVRFSNQMNWYVLKFNDGKTIRLSNMLSGHGGVIDTIQRLGTDVE